ncbi:MAG TPA: hypothetical protein VHN80_28190, partial [Kineosporiaceae bacterium]|nr:hypothetical protein [Kineosporiaceae bacterium]
MGPQPHTEILTDGRVEPVTGLVWRWLRGNPRVALTLTAVALMALVGAGLTARRVLRDPGMSPLTVDGDAASSPMADPWQPGWDGRPRGPVTLAVTVGVRRPRNARKEALNVTGIAGPGIVSTESPPVPVMVPVLGAIQVPLRAAVDCSQVPPTVPGDAYRLQITIGGRARRESVVSAGKPGEGWARAVQMACATWAARRYLTVSTISARVHPTLPRADLTITIVNTGTREAIVDTPESAFPDVAVQGAFPLRVPQLSAVTAHVTVQLDRCDVVGSARTPPDRSGSRSTT